MVSIYMKNDILSLKRGGLSNRKIAKSLNISKDTVNKCIKDLLSHPSITLNLDGIQ